MTILQRIKRRTLASGTGAPGSLLQGELAYSEHDQRLYIGIEGAAQHVIAGAGSFATYPGAGLIVQTAAASGATPPTVAARVVTGTASEITVANGNGVADNPTISIAANPVLTGNSGMILPQGTTAQRVNTTARVRYNSTDNIIEWYNGTDWVQPGVSGGEANQNAFSIITGDAGTANSDSTTDTLNIAGGDGVATLAAETPDSLTINLDFASVTDLGGAPQAVDSFLVLDDSASALREMTIANLFTAPAMTGWLDKS